MIKNLFGGRPGVLAAVLLAAALSVGFLGGVVADRLLLAPRASYAAERTPPPAPDTLRPPARRGPGGDRMMPGQPRPDRGRYLEVLSRQLELTDEQRERIVQILAAQESRMQEIARETRPRMRAVAEDTRVSIDSVLTDDQRTRFQELRRRRDLHGGHRGDGERRRPRVGDTVN